MSHEELLLRSYTRTARDLLTRALDILEVGHGVEAASDELIKAVAVAEQLPRLLAELQKED